MQKSIFTKYFSVCASLILVSIGILGSALMLASQQGSVLQGVVLLFCYSMGLGVPFLISAVLIQELKGAFGWIKSHYGVINRVCGLLLVAVGILMMTGVLSRVLSLLAV